MNVFDSYIDAGQHLSRRDRGRYYTALLEYLAYGIEPDVEGAPMAIITAIRPSLNESRRGRERGLRSVAARRARKSSEQNAEIEGNRTPENEGTEPAKSSEQNAEIEGNRTPENEGTKGKGKGSERKDPPKGGSKRKPERHRYGEYQNVLLSDDELAKLKAEYHDWEERIERLSGYVASKGASYKSHYATIRNWARRDAKADTAKEVNPKYAKYNEGF